jgi:3-isopropylmalate/(R)-2-methylmalate dehydratase small subunit
MTSLPATITGTAWKLGDHVNTDILHPPAYFSLDHGRMKEGFREGMERLKTSLKDMEPAEGLVIVAGENFGCGSSRETSARSLRLCGVRAVVARSFARIFYRSLANLGIPPVEADGIHDLVQDGDRIRLSLADGIIELNDARRFPFPPFDPHIERILASGGLIPYLRSEHDGL